MVVDVPSGFASSMRMRLRKFPLVGNAPHTVHATLRGVHVKLVVVIS
jgi:hypothetical protein